MVGGQDTNLAAAVQRFITNPVHTSMATEKSQHHSIPIFSCFWGQGPLRNQLSTLKVFVSCHVFGIGELTFHFLAAHYIFLLHLFPDVPSISWCSEYLLQLRAQSSVETHTTDSLYSLTSYLLANMFTSLRGALRLNLVISVILALVHVFL